MENTARHYFAGRCTAKMAAIECLSWHHWNHQTHMDAMTSVGYSVADHENLSAIMDEITIFLENREMALSDVLTKLEIADQSRRAVKAFRDGVIDELMHIRTFQQDVIEKASDKPEMAH